MKKKFLRKIVSIMLSSVLLVSGVSAESISNENINSTAENISSTAETTEYEEISIDGNTNGNSNEPATNGSGSSDIKEENITFETNEQGNTSENEKEDEKTGEPSPDGSDNTDKTDIDLVNHTLTYTVNDNLTVTLVNDKFDLNDHVYMEIMEGDALDKLMDDLNDYKTDCVVTSVLPLNISVLDPLGNEVEKGANVKIGMDYELQADALFHLKTDGKWEKLEYTVQKDETEENQYYVEFDVESLSPFIFANLTGKNPGIVLDPDIDPDKSDDQIELDSFGDMDSVIGNTGKIEETKQDGVDEGNESGDSSVDPKENQNHVIDDIEEIDKTDNKEEGNKDNTESDIQADGNIKTEEEAGRSPGKRHPPAFAGRLL